MADETKIKEDAKTCPWCGMDAEVYQDQETRRWFVRCTSCFEDASHGNCPVIPYSNSFTTKEKAIKAWNTRLGEK